MSLRRAAAGAPLLAVLSVTGCPGSTEENAIRIEDRRTWPVIVDDPRHECADVGRVRVCWGERLLKNPTCDADACVVPREVPDLPSTSGWRCIGTAADRLCRPRSAWASPFVQRGDEWVQVHPRLPDDGEWTCSEAAGVTVCVGGAPPAGVAPSAPIPGYFCDERPERDPRGRICVDFSPDFPTEPHPWRCHFTEGPSPERRCTRDDALHRLGDPCDPQTPCVDGARCLRGVCIPPRPSPACAIDRDCKGGVCRFGSCVGRQR
jgi:hypothetical protein